MTQRQPRRRQPAIANGNHDTVVRIAAPKREDAYSRFFWLLVVAVLSALVLGVSAFVRDRDAAIVIRTKVEHHGTEIAALKVQIATIGPAVSRLETVAEQLTDFKLQLASSVSDRYTGSQASADRSALTDRLARLEVESDANAVWRAATTEWMRSRGGPQTSAKSSALFGAILP